MHRVILVCVLSFIFFNEEILPQGHISFNHLTVKDGLSQSMVTCIFQDEKGFMWFGTQDGLNRFDGYNFKIFKNNPSERNSLSDNFIWSIYGDKKGNLFIETQNGTFQKYNPRSETFKLLIKDSVDIESLISSHFGALLEEPGIRWIGGQGKETGLIRINLETNDTTIYKHNSDDVSSLSSDRVYSIFRDHSGKLWVGTFNGLDKLDETNSRFIHYRNDPEDPTTISDNYIWPIYEDSRGYLWIGTYRGGLNRFDPEKETFTHYTNVENDPTSLSDNCVYSIYEDKGGVIWVGTLSGGINYFYPPANVFEYYTNIPNTKNSLGDNSILSMCVDTDGYYWIGTASGGLDRFNYRTGKFKNFSNIPADSKSLISNSIQTLYASKSGIIWIGTFSSGLDAYDPKTGTFEHHQNNPLNNNSLSDNRIYSIIEDNNGFIWIGTYAGGLNRLEINTGVVTRFRSVDGDSTTLSSDRVWSMAFDNQGKLWLGTFGGGINVFDPVTNIITYKKNNPDDSTSIADNNIIRIFKDSKGNMWIGSTKGLSKYIKETNEFKNYREIDGLANDFIYGIEEDDSGNLWLSTNNGLSRFDPETESFRNFYVQDGLQGNEFNQNAFAKDRKTGRLLFGGPNGFNVFNPNSIKDNRYVPPVTFTNYLRYNTDDEEGKPILERGISVRDSILLTYKDNIVTFQFAALSYYNNSENQYKYKLEGFNENWIQLGNNHTITFTNLSPDNYVLRVIGSNNDGIWNEKGASLFVEVLPPWWRTNIAYAAYIIMFLSSLYGLRRFEINRREQKTKLRENELRLKATEAEKRAIEIENERKTKELEEARQLQLSMLPRELPKLPNLEIAAFMKTATEVGGDYYDFIVQENGILNVAFGDATGHGLQAGTMVTLMKGFFTSDAAKLQLQEFMNHCSHMIKEIKLGRILMSFSLLKIENNKMIITSAGMPPVFYYSKQKNEVEEIIIQGMPLGAMRKFPYKIVEKEIRSGDTILLLTDGLPEQMNPNEEMFDYPRVKKHFNEIIENTPQRIIEKLVESGDNWMDGRIQDDDITFVVIRIK